MAIKKASTGAELMAGDNENVLSNADGVVRLAPAKNLVPDSDFSEFDAATGRLRYWSLTAAPSPTHWAPYIRDENIVKQFARQVTVPIPLTKTFYDQEDELFTGSSPLDAALALPIAKPDVPRVTARMVSANIGYKAGWYTLAYGLILDTNWQTTPRITPPGPRTEPFELAQGQGFVISLPRELDVASHGVVLYMSEVRATENDALFAPMYAQKKFATKTMSQYLRMVGPFDMRTKASNTNQTYVGSQDHMDHLITSVRRGPFRRTYPLIAYLSYCFVTEQGISLTHSPAARISRGPGYDEFWFRPSRFPAGVKGWRPMVRFYIVPGATGGESEGGTMGMTGWYQLSSKGNSLGYLSNTSYAVVSGNPDVWPYSNNFAIESTESISTDTTGLPAPTEPTESPTLILDLDSSGLTPGKHYVKTSLFVNENEGPASDFTTQVISAGQGLRISKPLYHNKIENPDTTELSTSLFPSEWTAPTPPASVTLTTPSPGVLRWGDASNATTDVDMLRTPKIYLGTEHDRFSVRVKVTVDQYAKGRIKMVLEEYNASDVLLASTRMESLGGKQKRYIRRYKLSRRATDTATPVVTKLQATTSYVRVLVVAVGSGRAGGRNLTVSFRGWGLFAGWGRPRKKIKINPPPPVDDGGDGDGDGGVDPDKPGVPIVWEEEEDKDIYPHGGYCMVRLDPYDVPYYEQFTLVEKVNFETGDQGYVPVVSQANQMLNRRFDGGPIYGSYGWQIQKNGTNSIDTNHNYAYKDYAPDADIAHKFVVYINTVNGYKVDLGGVRSAIDDLAFLRLETDGKLNLYVVAADGVSAPITVLTGVGEGERLAAEIILTNTDTNNGTCKVRITAGAEGPDAEEASVTGINWFGRGEASRVYIGNYASDVNRAAIYDMYYDNILVTREGSNVIQSQGGNYIEYYGPVGTPLNEYYGPTGLNVPVSEDEDYSIGVNVAYDDVPEGTSVLRVRALDKDFNTIRVYDSVSGNLSGESDWVRKSITVHTPEDAKYLQFFSNKLGAGSVRIHGLQVEKGTVASPYDDTLSREGWFNVFLPTTPNGMSPTDPALDLSTVTAIRNIDVAVTDNEDVSTLIRYRSGNTFPEVDAATYTADWSELDFNDDIIEVRVDLASTVDNDSPEVRSVHMDLARPHSILCREDGTEYVGGALANGISVVHRPPNYENITMASGAVVEAPWGTEVTGRIKFNLEVFRRVTAEEISAHSRHVLESPDKRYEIRFVSPPEFTPVPGSRIYLPDGAFFQRETADIDAYILSEEVFE